MTVQALFVGLGSAVERIAGRRRGAPVCMSVAIVFLWAGCGGGANGGKPFVQFDSAGVTVTESARPLWRNGEAWTLSPEPDVSIGLREGDERYALTDVRGVRRLHDGKIAVLDGSNRVRIYGADGVHLADLGGEGDGPSEFRTAQYLGAREDSLFVFEAIGGNRKWFSMEGELLGATGNFSTDDRANGTLLLIGELGGDTAVGVRDGPAGRRSYEVGLHRQAWSIWRFGLGDHATDSVTEVPGAEEMILETGPRGTHHQNYVFGKYTVLAVSEQFIYVGFNDRFAIRAYDREGLLRAIVRRADEPRGANRSDFRNWIDQWADIANVAEDERAELEHGLAQLHFAESMPAFRSIAADTDGNLWVEEWEDVGLKQGSFSVFRPDGAWLGTVAVPDGLSDDRVAFNEQVIEIGSDYFLGVWSDEYDVDQVRLYRIEKPGQ